MNKNQKTDYRDLKKNPDKEKETYTHDEVRALIEKEVSEALNSAKLKWDEETKTKMDAVRSDAEKMASLSADERAKAELLKKEDAIKAQREQYMSERMEFEATKALANEKLPLSFAKLLSGKDTEETTGNINLFKTEFLKAIEDALNERLRGKTPKTASYVEESDPFLAGFGG